MASQVNTSVANDVNFLEVRFGKAIRQTYDVCFRGNFVALWAT